MPRLGFLNWDKLEQVIQSRESLVQYFWVRRKRGDSFDVRNALAIYILFFPLSQAGTLPPLTPLH
jgi:hypothetical protein